MKGIMAILRFYYAVFLIKRKKNYRKAYLVASDIANNRGISPHMRGTAFLLRADLLQELNNDVEGEFFEEIEQILSNKANNLDLMNDLDFILAVSTSYYQRIYSNKVNDNDVEDKNNNWLATADFYRKRAETLFPYNPNIITTLFYCLGAYILLNKYKQAIELCENSLIDYQKVLLIEQAATLNFYKAKTHMELKEYKKAFDIYKDIISKFQKGEERSYSNNYLFHIYNDIGQYYHSINEDKQAIEYFHNALSILQKMSDKDKNLKVIEKEKEIIRLISTIEK